MHKSEWFEKLKGGRVSVVGLGISNLPLIDFLLSCGATVVARDQKSRAEMGGVADELEKKGVRLSLGKSYLQDLDEDVIFRSPGMRPDLPVFCDAVSRGAILSSEMELFWDLTPATLIGISGSDGKTTTTTLTGLILQTECQKRQKGRVFVGGNIGEPLLPRLREMTADDFAVVELSSFQLQTMRHSAHRAAITNVTPNHLNWHTDMEEYARAKSNLFRHPENRLLVVNAENAITAEWGRRQSRPVVYFSSIKTHADAFEADRKSGDKVIYVANGAITVFDGERERAVLNVDEILLPGKHNLENYMTAIALTDGLVGFDSVRSVAKSFTGVPHRLELVRTVGGVRYYNSSIDSSPTRTAAALSALRESPIVICGGYDKKIPFEPLAQALCQRAKAVVLTGATAEAIGRALRERIEGGDTPIPIYTEAAFRDAVLRAHSLAREGDTVLLSPACASFDAFRNFEERGNCFRSIVEEF